MSDPDHIFLKCVNRQKCMWSDFLTYSSDGDIWHKWHKPKSKDSFCLFIDKIIESQALKSRLHKDLTKTIVIVKLKHTNCVFYCMSSEGTGSLYMMDIS